MLINFYAPKLYLFGKSGASIWQAILYTRPDHMYYDMGVVIFLEDKRGSLCIKKEQKMPSGNIELECQMSCGLFEVAILSCLIKRLH